ncbi:MAG TPA: DUF354 domain-containing protein [archaeon]|nr:DUF354 domain-containing protein [archaeon]
MGKVWIDILTPKQVYLFAELSRRLEAEGHNVLRTTRHYREVNELMALKGLDAVEIGRHGGKTLEGKLDAYARRVILLMDLAVKYKPDVAVSFSSPEAARVAFGLGIPHICVSDSPHAEAVCRLTIPLSKKLIAPKIIPLKVWRKYGVTEKTLVQYNALDPVAWIRTLRPDERVFEWLKVDPTKPIITFRAEEAFAAYLLGTATDKEPVILPIIRELVEKLGDRVQFVAIPRYGEQAPVLRASIGERLTVPETAVDGPSLLSYTSIFVGAGGTMTAEAALLGVPTISCYPGKTTLVEKYLVKEGLVTRITDPKKTIRKTLQIFSKLDSYRAVQQERAKMLLAKMEDPIDVILREVKTYLTPTVSG